MQKRGVSVLLVLTFFLVLSTFAQEEDPNAWISDPALFAATSGAAFDANPELAWQTMQNNPYLLDDPAVMIDALAVYPERTAALIDKRTQSLDNPDNADSFDDEVAHTGVHLVNKNPNAKESWLDKKHNIKMQSNHVEIKSYDGKQITTKIGGPFGAATESIWNPSNEAKITVDGDHYQQGKVTISESGSILYEPSAEAENLNIPETDIITVKTGEQELEYQGNTVQGRLNFLEGQLSVWDEQATINGVSVEPNSIADIINVYFDEGEFDSRHEEGEEYMLMDAEEGTVEFGSGEYRETGTYNLEFNPSNPFLNVGDDGQFRVTDIQAFTSVRIEPRKGLSPVVIVKPNSDMDIQPGATFQNGYQQFEISNRKVLDADTGEFLERGFFEFTGFDDQALEKSRWARRAISSDSDEEYVKRAKTELQKFGVTEFDQESLKKLSTPPSSIPFELVIEGKDGINNLGTPEEPQRVFFDENQNFAVVPESAIKAGKFNPRDPRAVHNNIKGQIQKLTNNKIKVEGEENLNFILDSLEKMPSETVESIRGIEILDLESADAALGIGGVASTDPIQKKITFRTLNQGKFHLDSLSAEQQIGISKDPSFTPYGVLRHEATHTKIRTEESDLESFKLWAKKDLENRRKYGKDYESLEDPLDVGVAKDKLTGVQNEIKLLKEHHDLLRSLPGSRKARWIEVAGDAYVEGGKELKFQPTKEGTTTVGPINGCLSAKGCFDYDEDRAVYAQAVGVWVIIRDQPEFFTPYIAPPGHPKHDPEKYDPRYRQKLDLSHEFGDINDEEYNRIVKNLEINEAGS
ncbi:MAG TPA: hypothetical protein VJA18_04145 [Candidatus Nanoarchaeia archaeon]|nr:hypothetical protein [Candidatus Nanoarchaeia archaeon]